MNATKRAEYLRYLADPEQKIHETDKVERKRLNSIKRRVLKEFCMDSRGQLLHIAQKKGDITKPQAFIYDTFDHIERIHAAGGHNGYKKTYQRVKKELHVEVRHTALVGVTYSHSFASEHREIIMF